MRIFETENKLRKIVVYNAFNEDLVDRHTKWCSERKDTDKAIYLIFVFTTTPEYQKAKSYVLENPYCLLINFNKERSEAWIKQYCTVSFTDSWVQKRIFGKNPDVD